MKSKGKKFLGLALLLSLGMSQAATPTGTITIVDQFQPQTVTAGGSSSYRMEIGSTQGQPLTNVGFTVDLSPAYSSIQSFTSTCGGTVTWTGTTATFNGGTMKAATGASNPTICDVTITGTATLTSGTKNIAVGAQSITTDQGLTNSNGTASTLTITPLNPLNINSNIVEYNFIEQKASTFSTAGSTNLLSIVVQNPTGINIPDVKTTTNIPYQHVIGTPKLLTTIPPGINTPPLCQNVNSSYDNSSNKLISSGINLDKNSTCSILYELDLSQGVADSADEGYYITSTPTRGGGTTYYTNLIETSVDPRLSSSTQSSTNTRTALEVAKNFNGNVSYSPNYDLDDTVKMNIMISIGTIYPTKYSLTDNVPKSLIPVDGSVTVSPSTCSLEGVAFDITSNTFTMNNTPIPKSSTTSMCTYSVVFKKPNSPVTNYIYSNSVGYTNSVETVIPGQYSSGIASSAFITNRPGYQWSKSGFGTYKGNTYYIISFANSANYPITGVHFTDSWTHNLKIDSSKINTTQCGGNITLNPDNKGFSFNGNIPAGDQSGYMKYCSITIPIDPATALVGNYPNTTSAATTDYGTLTPISGTITIIPDPVLNPQGPDLTQKSSYTVNLPDVFGVTTQNTSSFPETRTISGAIPATLNIDLSKDVIASCYNYVLGNGSTYGNGLNIINNKTLDPSQYNINNGFFTITDIIPPEEVCEYKYIATSTSIGNIKVPGTVSYDGNTYNGTRTGDFFSYSTIAENSYNVNKTFSPQTVVAGGDTALSFSISYTGSHNDSYSNSYATITDHLPDGMIVSPVNYTPNQADGSYRSPDSVPSLTNNNPPAFLSNTGLPCMEISSDRKQIVSRCRNELLYSKVMIRITKYGDLINTIQPSDVQPFYGNVIAPASASAKATQGVPIIKSFNPKVIKSGQQSQFSVTVYNAATELSGTNTINFTDTLPKYVTADPNPAVTGTCTGVGVAYNTTSKQLSYSGIQLQPNTNCTVTIPVTGTSTAITNVSTTNTIPANNVVSTLGSSNPQPTSDTLTITPGSAQPGIVKEQGICSDSTCSNVTYTKDPISVKGCQYVSYRLTFNNSGYSPAFTPVARDPWPAGMVFKGASSPVNSAYNTVYQVDNNGWQNAAPTNVTAGQELKVGLDSNKDGQITVTDQLNPNQVVQVFLTGQVQGNNCQ